VVKIPTTPCSTFCIGVTPPRMPCTHLWHRQYLPSRARNVLYPPKFVKIVIKLPAELTRMVQPEFAIQARHRETGVRDSDSFI